MLIARDGLNKRVRAAKGVKAFCPGCGNEVIAKCGSRVVHHWAHKVSCECDWDKGKETPWHIEWKERFANAVSNPTEIIEVVNNGRRADVMLGDLAIEFQHSPIDKETMRDREEAHSNVLWVFDWNTYGKNRPLPSFLANPSVVTLRERRDLHRAIPSVSAWSFDLVIGYQEYATSFL